MIYAPSFYIGSRIKDSIVHRSVTMAIMKDITSLLTLVFKATPHGNPEIALLRAV